MCGWIYRRYVHDSSHKGPESKHTTERTRQLTGCRSGCCVRMSLSLNTVRERRYTERNSNASHLRHSRSPNMATASNVHMLSKGRLCCESVELRDGGDVVARSEEAELSTALRVHEGRSSAAGHLSSVARHSSITSKHFAAPGSSRVVESCTRRWSRTLIHTAQASHVVTMRTDFE
jgi:hypothetical protein